MNTAPSAPVVRAPSTSTNPFENKINLSTKEGISEVLSSDSKNSSESQPPVTAFHQTYEEVPGTILVNTESFCITTTNSLKIKSPR